MGEAPQADFDAGRPLGFPGFDPTRTDNTPSNADERADGPDVGAASPAMGSPVTAPTRIGDWLAERAHRSAGGSAAYVVSHTSTGRMAVLTLFPEGRETDPGVYEAWRALSTDHVPELLETGTWQGRAYEVVEHFAHGTLAEQPLAGVDPARIKAIVSEIACALREFGARGLRHRALTPAAIAVRSTGPLELVVTSFGSARRSTFDLDIGQPLEQSRYTAPEALAGAIAPEADWWSLGIIILELATSGACFEGINDAVFLMHAQALGVRAPNTLPDDIRSLVHGLLQRDRAKRWGWPEVSLWLAGDQQMCEADAAATDGLGDAPAITLGERAYRDAPNFVLRAARAENWQEAREKLARGEIATWAADLKLPQKVLSRLKSLRQKEGLSDDIRLGLALRCLHDTVPFVIRGDIVTPAWLLEENNLDAAYDLVTGPAPDLLAEWFGDRQLRELKQRAEAVRKRAAQLEIALDETTLRVALLATSRDRLERRWETQRRLFPDARHRGLASLLQRRQIGDADLIVMLCAETGQFLGRDDVVASARNEAYRAGIAEFDEAAAHAHLDQPQHELLAKLRASTGDLAVCGIAAVDDWVEQFRLERRISLPRALAVLAVPPERWQEPPKQDYYRQLVGFFEKKVISSLSRGPLVRMTIGRTSPRLDLTELASPRRSAPALLDHILSRSERAFELDPAVFADPASLPEARIRRLDQNARLYKRDTGIDGLYVGFPFLVQRGRDDTRQPRIAPILLWPVTLDVAVGLQGNVRLAFDKNREDVRLNPALEAIIGRDEVSLCREILDDLLAQSSLCVRDVIDGFGARLDTTGNELGPLPARNARVEPGTRHVLTSAVLFNVEYAAQAIVDDLRSLQRRESKGTALGRLLRVEDAPASEAPASTANRVPEIERFFTAEIDPSQEAAVIAARQPQGLLLEGPPGTGKSQTIVNSITDAIGRGKSVLVVCQKQAALDVVRKRLDALDLASRFVMIGDINKDRKSVLRTVREQIDELRRQAFADTGQIATDRKKLAQSLTRLEGEIDARHEVMRRRDPRIDASYREVVAELIELDEGPIAVIDVSELRGLLVGHSREEVAEIARACASVAREWLPSRFEESPYRVLKPFPADTATTARFWQDFERFDSVEAARDADLSSPQPFEVEDVRSAAAWLHGARRMLHAMTPSEWRQQVEWSDYFIPSTNAPDDVTAGRTLCEALNSAARAAQALCATPVSPETRRQLMQLDDAVLSARLKTAERAMRPATLLDRMTFARHFARRSARKTGASLGLEDALIERGELVTVLVNERRLRNLKSRLSELRQQLGLGPSQHDAFGADQVAHHAAGLAVALTRVGKRVTMALASPAPRETHKALRSGNPDHVAGHLQAVEAATQRATIRNASREALSALSAWCEPAWLAQARTAVDRGISLHEQRHRLLAFRATLPDYQAFRRRAGVLDEGARAVLARLRYRAGDLERLDRLELGKAVANTIEREARVAWKERLELEEPKLLRMPEHEVSEMVAKLAENDRKMRDLNANFLASTITRSSVDGTQAEWRQITRLIGNGGVPRSSIRDLFEHGIPLGLLEVRPVWLMNPDVASRVLPLAPGLFDVVIFDEASQMPVEYALPTLFRAKTTMVSGDEKQMPPTSFFSAQVEDDETGDEAALEELDREALAETWNRQEIKDCPDLLQLARSSLPSRRLEVHYRSAYRELIAFSNAAFYGNSLNVPVQHPEEKIRSVRPLEVIRVDGVYRNQSNRDEADRIVGLLAKLWEQNNTPPSVGVVTFNRKQADLIEDRIEARAESDQAFRDALVREQNRTKDHEDVGFFVKNVENVQGDERDWIIFSTTFGPNENGSFRRNFGVLGQTGGRRRLNVAISRAREKVVLVTSMPTAKISDMLATSGGPETERDYIQGYLAFAEAVSGGQLEASRSICRRMVTDAARRTTGYVSEPDGFVRSVAVFIESLGHTAVPATTSDAFALDFAIPHPATGDYVLGIECDAPSHPMLATARARDIWRRKILGGTVGQIHRIAAADWLERGEEERERLRSALEQAMNGKARRVA